MAVILFKNETFLQTVFTDGLHLFERVKHFLLQNIIGNLISTYINFDIISENPSL